jgi:carboxyl-terminal processing protease
VPEKKSIDRGARLVLQLFIGVVLLGGGFALGVYHQQFYASIASVFGIRASADQIDTKLLQETYQKLKANYDGQLNEQALINGARRGMVAAAGDKYTAFFNRKEAAEFDSDLSGSIGGGIGTQIGLRDNRVTIIKVLKDTPAEKAGLQAGDTLIAVNGESMDGKTTDDAVKKIRGDIDTTVKLTIARGSETKDVTITRKEIIAPSVDSQITGQLATITVSRFDKDTGQRVREAAEKAKAAGVKGVILDLRGNPGGYLNAAQDVSSVWLNDKLVVTEKRGDKETERLKSGKNPVLEGVPTVVLVDENSASASEIVAGALKDNKAATLVGTKTYGKGSVQQLLTLSDGALLSDSGVGRRKLGKRK